MFKKQGPIPHDIREPSSNTPSASKTFGSSDESESGSSTLIGANDDIANLADFDSATPPEATSMDSPFPTELVQILKHAATPDRAIGPESEQTPYKDCLAADYNDFFEAWETSGCNPLNFDTLTDEAHAGLNKLNDEFDIFEDIKSKHTSQMAP